MSGLYQGFLIFFGFLFLPFFPGVAGPGEEPPQDDADEKRT
jgi:hypothetical protein